MGYELWSQDNFSKGELSPYMYARADQNFYYNGLKTAQNVLTYPTGAAGKRFGTLYQATLTGFTSTNEFYFQTFQYLNECIYQVIFAPGNIYIYLEGILVATVSTSLDAETVFNLNYTILGNIFRVTAQTTVPMDLTRSANSGNVIASVGSNLWTLTTPITANIVLPVQVTTSNTLPTTVPQINQGVTYFIYTKTTTTAKLYFTAYDAKFDLNAITLVNNGTGTNTVFTLNDWDFSATTFKNLPIYDFNGATTSYDALTFTPGATTGAGVTITVTGAYAPLNSSYIGGAFIGGGGTSRITAVASTTSFTVSVQLPFDSINPILGSLAILAEPAWSSTRGWPQKCSSYQNRAIFANTASLPNGFWASAINDYPDFGDLTSDDDDAISWFPTSNDVNFIRFIVPYRSITVHTNSGIYSSPLSDVGAITPSTFTLQLQDSTPADVLLPQAIDNQIIVLSGDDAHTMLWDGINNAYTTDIVSVPNEQVIRNPVDEASFADLRRAGSRYVFIINENGSMAVFQTLISQEVAGFTPQIMEQSYGSAQFRQVASSSDGRCWFVVQRQKATAQSPITISGFTSTSLTATGSNFPTGAVNAITFTTTGNLPSSPTPINTSTYYWVIGIDANTFRVYESQEDAVETLQTGIQVNPIVFTSAGTSSNVIEWPLTTIFTLEELTQDTYLDCAIYYINGYTNPITVPSFFNAQDVKMVGNGFGYDTQVFNSQANFERHGEAVEVSEAYIGFPINTIIETMPLTLPPGKQTSLTKPKHIRSARFMFNNTIGGTINGIPIALNSFSQANIGLPPFPSRGIFELSIMKGWDDFNNPTFTIEHNDPFNIELLGVFYSVDI